MTLNILYIITDIFEPHVECRAAGPEQKEVPDNT